jgi:hypothetical protein
MKSIVKAMAAAAVLVAPALAFAQSDTGLTRAQVKQDLKQVEAAGYNPALNDQTNYPQDVQAAERRVSRQNGAGNGGDAYGGVANGTSASGSTAMSLDNNGVKPTYFGR